MTAYIDDNEPPTPDPSPWKAEHCSICKREVGEAEVGERGAWVTVCVACVAKAEGLQ